jgi:hypothetical protein
MGMIVYDAQKLRSGGRECQAAVSCGRFRGGFFDFRRFALKKLQTPDSRGDAVDQAVTEKR